jgi:magnesium transporter
VGTALLFDRKNVEAVDDWEAAVASLHRSSILWIDLDGVDERLMRELVDSLGLTPESRERLASRNGKPVFGDFERYLHVTVFAPAARERADTLVRVDCLVSKQWVVTVHDEPVPVIEEFQQRAEGSSGDTGKLDGLEFLATLLDWVLNSYLEAFDAVEDRLREFDTRAMEGHLDRLDDELRGLVELRAEVGTLRRALVSHREPFLALTRPELADIASSAHAERFGALRSRLEDAVQGARDCRDAIVGSFDVLIARTEQRTNEIVKVLTLVSVLLLPGAVLAGVLGMNFEVGFFDNPAYFWVVVAVIVAFVVATLVAARVRRWI